uniref:Legionella secretion system protein B n=1 Tax=Ganoderma boninense TaxID=34458 RepID=A0A5K1JTL8_9APHY|nr:Legionella secretion system protein B [Ganoderma boninense]
MDIIRDHAGLTDAWVTTHPNIPSPTLSNPPSPQDAIRLHGVTADSPLNSYSAGKPLEPLARKFQGKRLDYVFYRQPSSLHATPRTPVLRAVDTRVVMTERVPGFAFSYSDHFGLEATFEIEGPRGADITDPNSFDIPAPATPRHTHMPSFSISSQANPQPALSSRDVSNDSITQALISLTARYRFAQSQGKQQLFIFLVCLFVLIAIISTSAWFPFYVNPVLFLITVLVAWFATTMLYVGFVYGNWEVNALTNIIEELELYRASLEAGQRSRFSMQ